MSKELKPIAYLRVYKDAIEIIRKGNTGAIAASSPELVKKRIAMLESEGYCVAVKYMRADD